MLDQDLHSQGVYPLSLDESEREDAIRGRWFVGRQTFEDTRPNVAAQY